MSLEVICPPNVSAGDTIEVQAPSGGTFNVVVPPGTHEHDCFLVEPPVDAFMEAAPAMDHGSAELLRAVLQALHDDESLDEFVDEHSEKFLDYDPEGEQSLAWGTLHAEYVELVERVLGRSLRAVVGARRICMPARCSCDSLRGQRFLDKLYATPASMPSTPPCSTLLYPFHPRPSRSLSVH